MKISTFFYCIKEGIKSILQNRMFSLASIGTITACLFLFGIFYFIASNFTNTVNNLESSVSITVFFDEGISEKKIEEIGEDIKACKDVERIEFVSADEAWRQFQEENFEGNKNLVNTFGNDNPLKNSASYNVYLSSLSGQDELVRYIEKIDGVRQVNSSSTAANSLNSFKMLVSYISASIIVILLGVSVFLISTTVSMGIAVRKEEIFIMKLVGATDAFIQTPFVVEGVLIGLIGALVPLGLLYIIYNNVIEYVTGRFAMLSNWLTFVDVDVEFQVLMPLSLIVGLGIGFFGSMLTVRKQLRQVV